MPFVLPRPSHRFMAILGFCLLIAPLLLHAAPPTPEDRKTAEKLFADVYGSDYEKLGKSNDLNTRMAFVKKLAKSAEDVAADDPIAACIIREKAIPLAMTASAGFILAHDMIELQLPYAASKTAGLSQLADIKDRLIRLDKNTYASKIPELMTTLKELAAEQTAQRDCAGARKTLDRARTLARLHLRTEKELLAELDLLYVTAVQQEKCMVLVNNAEKVLKENPDDSNANRVLGLYHLLPMDDAKTAIPYLLKSGNDALKKMADLLTDETINELLVADAMRAAGETNIEKEFKDDLLAQALRHYTAIAEAEPKHPEITRIKLTIVRLNGSLKSTPNKLPVPTPTTETTPKALLLQHVNKMVKAGKWSKSPMKGSGKVEFQDVPAKGAILVGLEISYGDFNKKPTIKSFRPIYIDQTGVKNPGRQTYGYVTSQTVKIEAKPGYAVGSVNVQSGLGIDGLSITFMEITETGLNPEKAYTSDWHGHKDPDTAIKLGGDGSPIVGIFGKVADNARSTFNGFGIVRLDEAGNGNKK